MTDFYTLLYKLLSHVKPFKFIPIPCKIISYERKEMWDHKTIRKCGIAVMAI